MSGEKCRRVIPGRMSLGCEVLVESPSPWFYSARLGILANLASCSGGYVHVTDLIRKAGGRVHSLFSPQHGYFAEKQANMRESSHGWDACLNAPIYSLYGAVREPTEEMLGGIDVLLIDLQDVGTRVYTYGTTMGLCLEAAGRCGLKVVILDRPNPIGGDAVEGNILDGECRSFVGRYPIPMRHGLTLGELARFLVMHCGVSCELEVVPLKNWKRRDFFVDTQLPWFYPSPNMPSWETALLYPGMVLLEGCNVSEGRGTTLPFHLFGAPFLDQKKVGQLLDTYRLEGAAFRPVCFEPVCDKWEGEPCYGFQIHVTDPEKLRPYHLGLSVLKAIMEVHPEEFEWLPPPYEYEWEKLPIDILIGDRKIRSKLEGGEALEDLEGGWMPSLVEYLTKREECLMYT